MDAHYFQKGERRQDRIAIVNLDECDEHIGRKAGFDKRSMSLLLKLIEMLELTDIYALVYRQNREPGRPNCKVATGPLLRFVVRFEDRNHAQPVPVISQRLAWHRPA